MKRKIKWQIILSWPLLVVAFILFTLPLGAPHILFGLLTGSGLWIVALGFRVDARIDYCVREVALISARGIGFLLLVLVSVFSLVYAIAPEGHPLLSSKGLGFMWAIVFGIVLLSAYLSWWYRAQAGAITFVDGKVYFPGEELFLQPFVHHKVGIIEETFILESQTTRYWPGTQKPQLSLNVHVQVLLERNNSRDAWLNVQRDRFYEELQKAVDIYVAEGVKVRDPLAFVGEISDFVVEAISLTTEVRSIVVS